MNKHSHWKFSHHLLGALIITLISSLSDLIISGGNLAYMIHWFSRGHQSKGIGIIGGADGPTAIFISGNPLFYFLVTKLIFLCLLLLMYKPTKEFLKKI